MRHSHEKCVAVVCELCATRRERARIVELVAPALALFRSAIQGGEQWTETCEKAYEAAMKALEGEGADFTPNEMNAQIGKALDGIDAGMAERARLVRLVEELLANRLWKEDEPRTTDQECWNRGAKTVLTELLEKIREETKDG